MKSGRDSYLQFFRYYHTLKNMKVSQIFNYISFKRRRQKLSIVNNTAIIAFAEGLKQSFPLEDNIKNLEICFYNQPISFNLENMVWDPLTLSSETEKLWLIKLHSFDWLTDENSKNISLHQASYLVLDWFSKFGNEHSKEWEPYTLSKRLISLTEWLINNKVSPEVVSIAKLSISNHLKRLFVDFEYHKPANHLI